MTQIILVSGATWAVPSDWNSANNSIEGIGAGGNGADGTTYTRSGAGGGGGEYRKATNVTLTASTTVDINIPSGGAGSAAGGAWLKNNASTIVLEAKNGGNASGVTAGTAGTGGTGAAANFNGGAGGGGADSWQPPRRWRRRIGWPYRGRQRWWACSKLHSKRWRRRRRLQRRLGVCG